MMAGNIARIKLKAIAEALVEIAPSTIPFQKKRATSYSGIPSKNGSFINLALWLKSSARLRKNRLTGIQIDIQSKLSVKN